MFFLLGFDMIKFIFICYLGKRVTYLFGRVLLVKRAGQYSVFYCKCLEQKLLFSADVV